MTKHVIRYGKHIPDESELRLGGDIDTGMRVIELGVSAYRNSVVFAQLGAKSIAIDPRPEAIKAVRADAVKHDVAVECHQSDLGDLGFATSGSVGFVVAVDSLENVDDLSRVLRQINRVLRSSRPLVMSVTHPYQALHALAQSQSGAVEQSELTPPKPPRSISDWFTALGRSNFRVDQILELGSDEVGLPTNLVIRARKEGD